MMGMDQKRTRNAFVGSPVERIEDFRFLRGRGQFVDDLARDDLLHAVILRSSVAHGHIRGIETGAARARPGVYAVITAADIGAAIPRIPLRQESSPEFEPFEQPVIAHGKVRYVGEPVAIVLAESAGAEIELSCGPVRTQSGGQRRHSRARNAPRRRRISRPVSRASSWCS